MSFNEVLSAVFSLSGRGMDFGTERTRKLLDALGCPDKKLKIIHIAGTNGKGSTAEYVTQILIAAGKHTGTFISPAVFDYLEQFKIDGKPIEKELYAEAFGKALRYADGATQFEVETAGALYAFALSDCEYAVVECGLGGTYDATNAIFKKEVAVITSIGLEHTAILGNTLEEICKHKAGIIKDCPTVVSGYNPPEVLCFFEALGANVADKYENPPMHGEAQKYNAGLAVAVARLLKIDETSIYMGGNRAFLGGRCEILTAKGGKTYILDGAHNPAAFVPLAELIESLGGADVAVYGSLSDKDIDRNICTLKPLVGEVFIVAPNSARAMNADKVYATCKKYGVRAEKFESVSAALEKACGDTVVVCGSFTILREAKKWIEKRL